MTSLIESVPQSPTDRERCVDFHGGKSFEAIGEDFEHLERADQVVSADVLDAWFDPAPGVVSKLIRVLPYLIRTSPPIYAAGLVRAIAAAREIPESCIVTGGGSSDLIFGCLPQLLERAETALILDPMYSEYRHVLENVVEADVLRFALREEDNFSVDTDLLIRRVQEARPRLVAIVNPNSPTGQYWPRTEVMRFVDAIPVSTWIVFDETYMDYVRRGESLEAVACERANVIVIKSMSKVYALSGLRVGYLVSAPHTVCRLGQRMPPWGVSLPAQVAGVEALKSVCYYDARYRETRCLRAELSSALARFACVKVYESVANFVLIRLAMSAEAVAERMREGNVYVRNCDSMGSCFNDRFLRIAVKARSDNRRIVGAFGQSLANAPFGGGLGR